MNTQRILLIGYLVLGLLLAMVLDQLFGAVFGAVDALGFMTRSLPGFETASWATVLGFAVAAGVGVWAWRDARVHAAATQVVEELQRVTWPTMAETRAATVAVIVASLVAAVMLGAFDYTWAAITEKVYNPQ